MGNAGLTEALAMGSFQDARSNVVLQQKGSPSSAPNPIVVGNLTESQVVEFVNNQWREADQRMKPLQAIQDRLWQLYRNQEDFRDKEDWQSMLAIPKAPAIVRRAAASLRKLLFSSDQWIETDGWGADKILAPIVQKAMNELMMGKPFNFSQPFMDMLEAGLAVGIGIIKLLPTWMNLYAVDLGGDQQPHGQQVTLKARAIDYRKFKYGKYSTHETFDWTIEDFEVPYPLLASNPNVNLRNLEKCRRDSFNTPTEEDKDPERFDLTQATIARKSQINNVGVREYYGDIYDVATQEVVARDFHCLILNRKFLGMAKENWGWYKRPPYVAFSPRRIAFRFPGTGLIEDSRDIFRMTNKLANLGCDGLMYSMLKQFEADLSLLENPEDLMTGVEPGKIYRKRMGTNAVPAIREIQVSDSKAGGQEMQAFLDRAANEGSGFDPIAEGQTAERETTASEVNQRVAGTNELTLSIAADIEEQALEPLVEMLFWQSLQFLDSSTDPSWSKLIGHPVPIDQWTAEQRRQVIGGNYEFKFFGLSEAIRRMERATKLKETLEVIGGNPTFMAMVDLPKVFSDMLKAIGTGDYVNPQAEQIYQMLIMQQAQQAQQAMQQKLFMMQQQFDMRNASAMKRDVFKHLLTKDQKSFSAGIDMAKEMTAPQEAAAVQGGQ